MNNWTLNLGQQAASTEKLLITLPSLLRPVAQRVLPAYISIVSIDIQEYYTCTHITHL